MPASPVPPKAARRLRACALAMCALLAACDAPKSAPHVAGATQTTSDPKLAAARVDLAKARTADHAPDEALALLVSALEADPRSEEARSLAAEILTKTRWHLAETTLDHRLPVDRVEFAAPSNLWVSLAGESNTTVRWNLETPAIENLLFPINAPETRSLVFDRNHNSVVVERAGVTLLCNARTLKPVCDLGLLPDFVTPSSTIVFSPDGLLLAHPAFVSTTDHSLVWHLRDTTTGQIIRSSPTIAPERPAPLAAFLDRKKLRVLNTDGSLMEMPVSPVETFGTTPPAGEVRLLHAVFSENGETALTLKDNGPHHPPESSILPQGAAADASLDPARLLEHFPWSRHPGLWTGLLREAPTSPVRASDKMAVIDLDGLAPFRASSAIASIAIGPDQVVTGETGGTVTIHRTPPLPLTIQEATKPAFPDANALASVAKLNECLAGFRFDEASRSFVQSTTEKRLKAFKECDFEAIRRVFPSLDFTPVITALNSVNPKSASPETFLPVWDRFARADTSGASWPALLERTKDLADTPWHKELTAAVVARASKEPVKPGVSAWLTPALMEKTFDGGDDNEIKSAIEAAGAKGPAAAKALELALASTHAEWIEACLARAADLPPLLKAIARSRISWLRDQKADALAIWPEIFPDMKQVRLREDWDGWQQADFSQALEKLRLCVTEELVAIDVPENPTPEQRKAIAERLADPATMKAVGRARFAKACLKAALAFASFKDETAITFKLATLARDLGEAPAPCLRAEAMALTALGDYKQAHDRWVTLITEHPVEDQQPGDYAEASYTAFENADPRQAMTILTTGLHRFPNDANFALRAGWVALLTGNAERAYRFLLTGRQIGYPAEKLENATALLAIAAAQTGADEDAAAFYQDLVRLDADWRKPETIDSLDWPEELKASLRQLLW